MAFTFLNAFESDLAVVSYRGSFYGYRARSGYKFVIVEYRFQNTSNDEQTTPQLNAGDILTQPKGFIYKLWVPPTPTTPNLYNSYLTAPDEADRLGHSTGGNVKLQPEYGVRGRAIFEVPADMTPGEVSFPGITARLVLNGN
ncbi:MAG: hypothetical protein HY673_18730 [Chloroflexi bacterium]|nr:hypothetical protein [Chloroflexota bacterium]